MMSIISCCARAALGLAFIFTVAGCDDSETQSDTVPGAAAQTSPDVELPGCDDLPSADELREYLVQAPQMGQVGGLFGGRREWAAVTDRSGTICAVAVGQDSVSNVWPGSRGIALAKAYTANGFSTDNSPMSTARLYTMSQPGRSLYGAFAGNPMNPECLAAGMRAGELNGRICGGTIVFGGGLPIYSDGQVVGGLGVSGDTPCADHEIAKRVRQLAELVPPGGNSVDDMYTLRRTANPSMLILFASRRGEMESESAMRRRRTAMARIPSRCSADATS